MNRMLGFAAGFCAWAVAGDIMPPSVTSAAARAMSSVVNRYMRNMVEPPFNPIGRNRQPAVPHPALLERKNPLPVVLHADDPALCFRLVPRLVERADRVLPRTGDLDRPRAPAVIPLLPCGNR